MRWRIRWQLLVPLLLLLLAVGGISTGWPRHHPGQRSARLPSDAVADDWQALRLGPPCA
jgi:hypothetical protein